MKSCWQFLPAPCVCSWWRPAWGVSTDSGSSVSPAGLLPFHRRFPEKGSLRVVADFKTHITTSTALGIAYGFAGNWIFGIPLPHCIVAGGLCSVAGMLPDLDSDSGVPLREMLCFVSVLVPLLMLRRFEQMGLGPETVVLVSGLLYVAIRFGVGSVFRRYTKHRGMWHSIPAAMIAGLVTYLVCLSPETGIRLLKSWAVVLGFLSHLFLDEVYSIDLRGRRIKKSIGTAMKWYGDSPFANFITYAKLVFVAGLVFGDQKLMTSLEQRRLRLQDTAQQLFDGNRTWPEIFKQASTPGRPPAGPGPGTGTR